MENRPVAVYDANVLYPAQLRDLLMRLAAGGLVRAHWTDRIQEEWMRSVAGDYEDITREDLEYTRSQMERALPDARVTGYDHLIGDLSLPDPDDNHVLAAALQAGAEYIVTFNLKDFPEGELGSHGVEAVHPDALATGLIGRATGEVFDVGARHRASLRKPPLSREEYLQVLQATGLEKTVARLKSHADRL